MINYFVMLNTLAEDNIASLDFRPHSESGLLIPSWEHSLSETTIHSEEHPFLVDLNVEDRIIGLELFDILKNLPRKYRVPEFNHYPLRMEEDEEGLAMVCLDNERVQRIERTDLAGLQIGYSQDDRIVQLKIDEPEKNILKTFYDSTYS